MNECSELMIFSLISFSILVSVGFGEIALHFGLNAIEQLYGDWYKFIFWNTVLSSFKSCLSSFLYDSVPFILRVKFSVPFAFSICIACSISNEGITFGESSCIISWCTSCDSCGVSCLLCERIRPSLFRAHHGAVAAGRN